MADQYCDVVVIELLQTILINTIKNLVISKKASF